jgi:hypothetical protein
VPAFSLPALLRALAVWALIILAESVQGGLRRAITAPEAEYVVRQASVLVGALIIFGITWLCLGWLRIRTAGGALAIGLFWVVLTVGFEFALGRFLGYGWDRILSDYDLLHGGLMPLGLLAMALTPWLARRLKAGRIGLSDPPRPG